MNIELKTHVNIFSSNSNNPYFNSFEKPQKNEDKSQFILKMMKAGVHFGHKVKKWNPKMEPFIYQKLQGIHIIDIVQSYSLLRKNCKLLYQLAANKQYNTILFVGTRKESPIPNSIVYNASRCNSFFINNKWLSGMLTNWENTRKSIDTLKYLKFYQKTNNYNKLSMKIRSMIDKKKCRLEKYFGGIQNMSQLPDLVILVGQQSEITAARECRKLKIRNVTVLDTDCNPQLVDLFIPANDDSSSSLNLILGEFQIAINLGRQGFCNDIDFNQSSAIFNMF